MKKRANEHMEALAESMKPMRNVAEALEKDLLLHGVAVSCGGFRHIPLEEFFVQPPEDEPNPYRDV